MQPLSFETITIDPSTTNVLVPTNVSRSASEEYSEVTSYQNSKHSFTELIDNELDNEQVQSMPEAVAQNNILLNPVNESNSLTAASTSSSTSSDSSNSSSDSSNDLPVAKNTTSTDLSALSTVSNNTQGAIKYLLQGAVHNMEDNQEGNVARIGRKRKSNCNKWACVQAEISRNSGKSYTSKHKKVVPGRSLKPPCGDKCKLKCTSKISDAQRKELFDNYWAMADLQRQSEFILRHISTVTPRYSYKVHNSNRGNNNAFYLTVDQKRIRVCKQYFRAT
ncbi:unnamed protein product [Phaedon cochleariae]|uniref:Uncharacterized protein n=1 Tax=Phaedon cochleariae TaxID=80249 RepID=A0A9N9SMR2_PHACE|nr:unnamed protein product [Phaedon cochleariae]